jgi:hypothetical protein
MTIESEEFYNLCQAYRHAPVTDQGRVCESYQALIEYIDRKINEANLDGYADGQLTYF